MRKLIVLLSMVMAAVASVVLPGGIMRTIGGGAAPTYLLEQNFESAGLPSGWTTASGTPNYDYATAPAPLEATQSLFQDATLTVNQRSDSPTFTASAAAWGYVMYSPSTLPPAGNNTVITFRNGSTDLMNVQINSSGQLRANVGTPSSSYTVTGMSAGTVYHIWWHYTAGSGANAVGNVALSTTTTKPTSGNGFAQVTTGTSTLSVDNVRVRADGTSVASWITDKLRADDVDIGDNPP